MKGVFDVLKTIGILAGVIFILYYFGTKFGKPEHSKEPTDPDAEKEFNPRTAKPQILHYKDSVYLIKYEVDSVFYWRDYYRKGKFKLHH